MPFWRTVLHEPRRLDRLLCEWLEYIIQRWCTCIDHRCWRATVRSCGYTHAWQCAEHLYGYASEPSSGGYRCSPLVARADRMCGGAHNFNFALGCAMNTCLAENGIIPLEKSLTNGLSMLESTRRALSRLFPISATPPTLREACGAQEESLRDEGGSTAAPKKRKLAGRPLGAVSKARTISRDAGQSIFSFTSQPQRTQGASETPTITQSSQSIEHS